MECPICLNSAITEKHLTCEHSICKDCFNELYRQANDNFIICPLCRKHHKIPKKIICPSREHGLSPIQVEIMFGPYVSPSDITIMKFQPRPTISLKNYLKIKDDL